MRKITTLLALLLSLTVLGQNNSLNFDGIDDYVELGENFAFQPGDAFSIEAWVKLSTNNLKQIISKLGIENNDFRGWGFQTSSEGYISAYVAEKWLVNTRYVEGSTPLGDGLWHHVAMTYDGADTILLYLDGVEEIKSTNDVAGTITTLETSSTTHIGNYDGNGNPGEYFFGNIDELRIWSGVRTPTEIQDNYTTELTGTETNLIGYYKMDISNSSCDVQDCHSDETHGDRIGSNGDNDKPQFSSEIPTLTDVACSATVDCTLGIADFGLAVSLQVFPNPTNGVISFNTNEINGQEIQIMNVLGNTVDQQLVSDNTIDISSLPVGMYFLSLEIENQTITRKILKN
ncbi:MAG: LamG-like jellyroll fold domain-containing protein [Bacteroidota bacterium]